MQPNTVYESIQYRLEEEPFETIPDLVTCYVGSGKAVTAATGAKITTPVNRTQPLSLYASRYKVSSQSRHPSSPSASQQQQHNYSLYSGRNPLPAVSGRVRMVHPTAREYSTQSLPRPTSASERLMMRRRPSNPSLSMDEGALIQTTGPPKPSRIPSQIDQPEDLVVNDESIPTSLDQITESGGAADLEEESREAGDRVPQLPGSSMTLPNFKKSRNRPVSITRNSFLDRRSCDFDVEATFNQQHLTTHSDNVDQLTFDREFISLYDVDNFQVVFY